MRFTFAAFAILAFSQAALLPSENSYSELTSDAYEFEPTAAPVAAPATDAAPVAAPAADAAPVAAPAADAKPDSEVKDATKKAAEKKADEKKTEDVKDAPAKDAAVKDSEKAKQILDKADTKVDTTPKGS